MTSSDDYYADRLSNFITLDWLVVGKVSWILTKFLNRFAHRRRSCGRATVWREFRCELISFVGRF